MTSFSDKGVDTAESTKLENDLKNPRRPFTLLPEAKPQLLGALRDARLCELAAKAMESKNPANSEGYHLMAPANPQEKLTTPDKANLDPDQARRIAWIMRKGLQEFKKRHPNPTHKNVQQYNFLAEIHNKHIAKYAGQFPGQLPKRLDLIPLRELPKGERPDLIAPLLKLKGGIFYAYDGPSQEYRGRIITLRDPEGRERVFNRGETDEDIADFTSRRISYYRDQYVNEKIRYWERRRYRLSEAQIDSYKAKYNDDIGQALTKYQVWRLQEGDKVDGWNCTKIEYPTLPKEVYYTDMGTEIYALKLSNYQPWNREEHDRFYPPSRYYTVGDPTPIFNCHGHFINKTAWLVPEKPGERKGSQIQKILDDNGYYRIYPENAQINDIVVYSKDGNVSHTALVVDIDGKIIVESKIGDFGLIQHDIDDALGYGWPIIYHTERQGGHSLHRTRPMNPLS